MMEKKNDTIRDSNKLISIPIILTSKEADNKIAKLNETINLEKTQLTRDPQTKQYKLTEKKVNHKDAKFSSTHMAEQSSKYLIMKYSSETGKIEVIPAGDWYDFKKEINFPTMSYEEAEDRNNAKFSLLDYLRNKGPAPKNKGKKPKDETTITVSTKKASQEDEEQPPQIIESESEENLLDDPDLKELPSDIEEEFIKGKKTNDEIGKKAEIFVHSSEEVSDDDNEDLFDDNEEMSEGTDEFIDKLDGELEKKLPMGKEFLNVKRKGEEDIYDTRPKEKKARTGNYDLIPRMEDGVLHILSKYKRITFNNIQRELTQMNFMTSEIELHLNSILSKLCNRFQQANEYYYFKKSEK